MHATRTKTEFVRMKSGRDLGALGNSPGGQQALPGPIESEEDRMKRSSMALVDAVNVGDAPAGFNHLSGLKHEVGARALVVGMNEEHHKS